MMKSITELRIAFIGVSHWHVPQYLNVLKTQFLNIVAVSDPNIEIAKTFADKYSCRYYCSSDELIDTEKPDFVFAFAPHYQMPALAKRLAESEIPFSMEKPMGLSARDVEEIRNVLIKKRGFCAIPFVFRHSDAFKKIQENHKAEDFVNLSYTFIAGPPSRYLKSSEWMLHSDTAGSGCMTNLGVHFIDMALALTGSSGGKVLSSYFHQFNGLDIEDYATAIVVLESGATLVLQTGYAYPTDSSSWRNARWDLAYVNGYDVFENNHLESRIYGKKTERICISTDSDVYYPIYVLDTLNAYLENRRPRGGIDEMLQTRILMDEIIKCGRSQHLC